MTDECKGQTLRIWLGTARISYFSLCPIIKISEEQHMTAENCANSRQQWLNYHKGRLFPRTNFPIPNGMKGSNTWKGTFEALLQNLSPEWTSVTKDSAAMARNWKHNSIMWLVLSVAWKRNNSCQGTLFCVSQWGCFWWVDVREAILCFFPFLVRK